MEIDASSTFLRKSLSVRHLSPRHTSINTIKKSNWELREDVGGEQQESLMLQQQHNDYFKKHMPQVNTLGEMLLGLAKIKSISCRCCGRERRHCIQFSKQKKKHFKQSAHGALLKAILLVFVVQVALSFGFSLRIQRLLGGIFLLSGAATGYLFFCFCLCGFSETKDFAQHLLERIPSGSFKLEDCSSRSFLEYCSWVGSVLFSHTIFQSSLFSISFGAFGAIIIVLISDIIATYIRILEVDIYEQSERVSWLKVVISYCCVGYTITGIMRILQGFIRENVADSRTIDDLVLNYILVILVGVSLIVASELLLLYQPTRRAGMILQSRLVNARRNWEIHTTRSIIEVFVVFGVTVWSYTQTQDLQISLQLGTVSGAFFILSGEFLNLKYSFLGLWCCPRVLLHRRDEGRESEKNREKDAIESLFPADHWMKLMPLVCLMSYFFFRACSVILRATSIPAVVLLVVFAVLVAGMAQASCMALVIVKNSLKLRILSGNMCCVIVTIASLAIFRDVVVCISTGILSHVWTFLTNEYWDEFDCQELRQAVAISQFTRRQPNQIWRESLTSSPTNSKFYGRFKEYKSRWSTIYYLLQFFLVACTIISGFDLLSIAYDFVVKNEFSPSLFDFFAGVVLVSTCLGYISSSSSKRQLNPEYLMLLAYFRLRKKCLLFPLRSFIEAAMSVGVFICTFAMSSSLFWSSTLASLAGIIVALGGEWVCSRLQLNVGDKVRLRLTATCALVFCLFLFAYASLLCFFTIYQHIHSIEAGFFLATLSGVVFLASSELFLLCEPTREVGHILQQRVTNAYENWKTESLRSFLEFFTWLAVINGSFAVYNDLLLALQLGTFSGICVSLSGEYFRRKSTSLFSTSTDWKRSHHIKGIESSTDEDINGSVSERPRALPMMLLFAYIGSGTFQWIFENMRSIEVTVLLATIAGIAFLCIADLLVAYKPTRWAGVILQDRFLRAKQNWRDDPVRSFVELGCFLGVIYGSYAIYGDLIVAVQVGTLSGMSIALIGEQVKSHAGVSAGRNMVRSPRSEAEKNQILPLPVMSLLGLVGAVAFNVIYTHLRNIKVAFVLATMSGVAFVLLGDMFVIWKPTRKVGIILQERILFLRFNLKMHPLRTWGELLSCALALYISYAFLWLGDLLIAIQFGTFTGLVSCVGDELIMEYLREVERRLAEDAAAKWRMNTYENNSGLLALPYEVLYEIAHFLTPEDLLVTRSACHKINNMLRAESARFWLHTSLKKKLMAPGQPKERTKAYGRARRSLVYDAIKLVLPKLFRRREPSYILTSCDGLNQALKWVYCNANWIRKQGLAPLPPSFHADAICLVRGDVAFEVFRHMPDKSHLDITVERNSILEIERIFVPSGVYEKLQKDPLSFVAAETLSETEGFSNWHLAFVAFFAMTFIFIGQFSSDIVRPFLPFWN